MPLPLTSEKLREFPRKEGVLEKKSPSIVHINGAGAFQSRYFVLKEGHLRYYKGTDTLCTTMEHLKGDVDLALTDKIEVVPDHHGHGKSMNHVHLSCGGHDYHLRMKTDEEVQCHVHARARAEVRTRWLGMARTQARGRAGHAGTLARR